MNKTIYSLIKINTLGAISNFTLSKNFKKSKFKQSILVFRIFLILVRLTKQNQINLIAILKAHLLHIQAQKLLLTVFLQKRKLRPTPQR